MSLVTADGDPLATNPYFHYFKTVVGRGNGEYYTGIGNIYKSRRGIQRGYGIFLPGVPHGARRGLGLGSVFKSLFRVATPILRNIGTALGSTAVDVLSNTAKDALQGSILTQSFLKHGKTGAQDLLSKVPRAFSGTIERASPLSDHPSGKHTPSSHPDSDGGGRGDFEDLEAVPVKRRRVTKVRRNANKRQLHKRYPALSRF